MNIHTTPPKRQIRIERIVPPGGRQPLLRLHVPGASTLLAFLQEALPEKSRTTIKQLLHDRFIAIGIEPTTQFDAPLKEGDVVTIHPAPLPKKLTHKLIEVLYEDEYLIVLHKAAGVPTVASGEEKDKTVLRLLAEHHKNFNPLAKIYHINRLDKDSAGFVVFAKSRQLQQELTEHWAKYVRQQQFVAVLEGLPRERSGLLTPPAPEEPKGKKDKSKSRDSLRKPRTDEDRAAGRAEWHIITSGPSRCLVSISLLTGRNNRLRKQFAQLRHPIVGDWRNGSGEKELGQVALEGTHLSFVHPITKKLLEVRQPIPPLFRKLTKAGSAPARSLQGKKAPAPGKKTTNRY